MKRSLLLAALAGVTLASPISSRVVEARQADNFNFEYQPKPGKSKGEKKRAAAQRS